MQNNIIISAAKIFLVSLSFFAPVTVPQNVSANPLDDFRNTIKSERYTIKYEIENNNSMLNNIYRKHDSGQITNEGFKSVNPMDNYRPTYFIVCDGEKFFSENGGYNDTGVCNLRQGEKLFTFTKNIIGKKIYYSALIPIKNGKIMARRFVDEDITLRYGNYEVMRLLKVIVPDIPDTQYSQYDKRIYRQVSEGTSDDGLKYYDFKAEPQNENDTTLNVIRYYFDGNTPVKIASFSYWQDQKGEQQNASCIITIKEFSPVPDQNYLKLPEQLKEIE